MWLYFLGNTGRLLADFGIPLKFPTASQTGPENMVIDSVGNIIISGHSVGNYSDITLGSGVVPLPVIGTYGFVAKWNPQGSLQWIVVDNKTTLSTLRILDITIGPND